MNLNFLSWAKRHLTRLGVDYQAVDLTALYNSSLSWDENKTRLLELYPEENDDGPRLIGWDIEAFNAQLGGPVLVYSRPVEMPIIPFSFPTFPMLGDLTGEIVHRYEK